MSIRILGRLLLPGLLVLPAVTGCQTAATRYGSDSAVAADQSGWFWIVVIAVLTLIVGFLVGATVSRSGGIRLFAHRHHHRRTKAGWDRLAGHVREGTRQGLTEWRSLGHSGHEEDPDWNELSRAIEERILEELHRHPD